MNHKIQKIMQDNGLTPSHFADQIEVQRSTISHILVGRNKPSLEIIQKIKKRFPDISYDWLIDDNAEIIFDLSNENKENQFNRRLSTSDASTESRGSRLPQSKNTELNPNGANKTTHFSKDATFEKELPHNEPSVKLKVVEKVLVFYSDGTFSEYLSNNNV